MKISIPGIGGSLGQCIFCGECFALEVMRGRSVPQIGIEGFGDIGLPIHENCQKEMQVLVDEGKQWESLPEGPLRREYAEVFEKKVSK